MFSTNCKPAVLAIAAFLLSTPGVKAEDCVVKLGAVGPLSGGASAWGLAVKAGADFAAAVANEQGGVKMGDKTCKVQVFSYDAHYTAAGGAAAADYLASQGVHITMGPVGSPETTGFRPVAARNGIVNFSSSYMRDVIDPKFPLAFHALQAPVSWGQILIKEAKEQFHFKTVLITAPNDQGGTDSGKQLSALYGADGVTATQDYYERGTTNFAPLAERILNANPDTVETSSVPPGDAAILVKQLLAAGYDSVIGSLGGVGLRPIVDGAGGVQNLKNVYWLEVSPIGDPGIVKLYQDYKRVMNADAPANPLFPVFALAAEVALEGVAKAGTDQDAEKIAESLRALTPTSRYEGAHGWRGKALYGINQELSFPIGLGTIVNGGKPQVKTIQIPAEP